MQPNVKNLAVALIAGALVLPAVAQEAAKKAAPAKAAAGGRVVVNGVTIPQARFDALNRELNAQGQPDTPERQQAVKEELINRELLIQAATKKGLDKDPAVISQIDNARQGVLVRALFESEVRAHPITEDQLKQQYDQLKGQMGGSEYKVRHILVDKEEDAKAIIADLNRGGDFAKIAKDKSKDPGSKDNGGDLDWGPAARYVKPFADAVATLQKGQTTATPVKTDFGWHVIRLDDSRAMKVPEFTEVKDQFRQRAQQQQIQRYVADLRSKAKIEER